MKEYRARKKAEKTPQEREQEKINSKNRTRRCRENKSLRQKRAVKKTDKI